MRWKRASQQNRRYFFALLRREASAKRARSANHARQEGRDSTLRARLAFALARLRNAKKLRLFLQARKELTLNKDGGSAIEAYETRKSRGL